MAAARAEERSNEALVTVLRTEIDAALQAGEHPTVWVTLLGGPMRCKIHSADATSLKVDIQGNPFPVRWRDIAPDEIVGIAEAAATDHPDRLVSAARVAFLLGSYDRADKILTRAQGSGESLKADIAALLQEIAAARAKAAPPPAKPAPAAGANAAAPAPKPVAKAEPPPPPGPPQIDPPSTAGKSGRVLKVGPNQQYKTASAAARAAKKGDTVEIDAGLYKGDVMTWDTDDILVRGVGGMAHFDADGKDEGGKAIWVVRGHNVVIENIEFSNATVRDGNGAGIRIEASSMTLRNCYFHDNENGVLGGNDSELLFEGCEFYHNGAGDGYTHNIYIGHAKSFTMRFCYSHSAKIGHDVKSRASKNVIMYNRIMDESEGTASYVVDLPNGGLSYVIGNLIQKGPKAENNVLLTYAEEGGSNPIQKLYVINNTFVNDKGRGTFVNVRGSATAVVQNNLFLGSGNPIGGKAEEAGNLAAPAEGIIVNRADYDYRLTDTSPARGKGVSPGKADDFDLTPLWQYVHKTTAAKRLNPGPLDVGAYEAGFAGKTKEPVAVASADPPQKVPPAAVPPPPVKPPERKPPTPSVQRTPEQICQAWFAMAMNYKNANFKEDAMVYFNKILETYPNTEWAGKARVELAQIGG